MKYKIIYKISFDMGGITSIHRQFESKELAQKEFDKIRENARVFIKGVEDGHKIKIGNIYDCEMIPDEI